MNTQEHNLFSFIDMYEHHAMYYLDSEKVSPLGMPATTFYVQEKKDGVYGNIVCIKENGNLWNTVRVYSRDGKLLSNVQWTERMFRLVPEGVYQGEFCIFNGSFEDASRFYNPNVKNQLDLTVGQYSYVVLFDYVTIEEFIKGYTPVEYRTRYGILSSIDFDNSELWQHLVKVSNIEIFHDYKDALIFCAQMEDINNWSDSLEGFIIRQARAPWKRGGRDSNNIKYVFYLYLDLRIVGFKEGKGKHYGVVAKVVLDFYLFGDVTKAKCLIECDGKITYEQRKKWYREQNGYINKIGKVKAKGYTNKGMLRQPKFQEIRWDKHVSDFD